MAKRPVFVPETGGRVDLHDAEFVWHPGMSKAQKQRNVRALHESAVAYGLMPLLEVSTKSVESLGVRLSAMNLRISLGDGKDVAVECAFQSSKVFEYGGPFLELLDAIPRQAKRHHNLTESGNLIGFRFRGVDWPLDPSTAFYDWLYIQALTQVENDAKQLLDYAGFTDIEFNPKKSVNTQAHACARYVSLSRNSMLDSAMSSQAEFLRIVKAADRDPPKHRMDELLLSLE